MPPKQLQTFRARTPMDPRRASLACPCDLMALIDIAATRARPALTRRGQGVNIALYDGPLPVTADFVVVVDALEAGLLEASALSQAGEAIRVAACEDDGDVVVTIIGCNHVTIPTSWLTIDPRLQRIADVAGTAVELLWDIGEGPSVVFRMPTRRRWGRLANDR